MRIAFEASFARDLKRVKDKQLLRRVKQVIGEIKAAVIGCFYDVGLQTARQVAK